MRLIATLAILLVPRMLAQGDGSAPTPGAQGSRSQPSSPVQWREAARRDVLAAYARFVGNHPGMYDLGNPGFPAQLARARQRGLRAAIKATDLDGYGRALAEFSAVLADGHAMAVLVHREAEGAEQHALWPGYVALWRGDRLWVHARHAGHPLARAQIVGCEGQPIKRFLRAALRPMHFRPAEEGQWWTRPSRLFGPEGGRLPNRPRRCRYRLRNGREVERALVWSPMSPDDSAFFEGAVFGSRVATTLSEPRPGLFLIGLQDFHPNAQGAEDYRALYKEVALRRPELRAARALVLDLRFNNGGSSAWGEQLRDLLWGERPGPSHRQSQVCYRASAPNARFLSEVAERLRAQGRADDAKRVSALVAGIDAARAERRELHCIRPEADETRTPPDSGAGAARPRSDFETPIYVITHGGCASACLDAIDQFGKFPQTKLIGAPTSADSNYMEVRTEQLPAGPGLLVIPMKFYVDRPRAAGEVYRPDLLVTDLDWSTETFLDHIERDLGTDSRRVPSSHME